MLAYFRACGLGDCAAAQFVVKSWPPENAILVRLCDGIQPRTSVHGVALGHAGPGKFPSIENYDFKALSNFLRLANAGAAETA